MTITTLRSSHIVHRLRVPVRSWAASSSTIDNTIMMPSSVAHCRSLSSRQAKKEKKGKGSSSSNRLSDDDEMTNMLIACLDAKPRGEPSERRTEEEMKRRKNIVKAYTIGRFEQHNESEHDWTCKWKLKNFAIDAIPDGFLKDEAIKVSEPGDGGFPPLWRHHALHTPPIPGFNPADWLNDDEEDDKKKKKSS